MTRSFDADSVLSSRALRLAAAAAAAAALVSSCGLAGTGSTTSGFGAGGGGAKTVSSSSGDGGLVGPGVGGSGGATSANSSTSGGKGGAGGSGTGGKAAGGGGAGGAEPNCTPSDGIACCNNDVDCVTPDLCCLRTNGAGLTCASKCNGGLAGLPCETDADCGGMMMCCGHWHKGMPGVFDMVHCETACMPPPADPTVDDGEYQLCDTSQGGCLLGTCTSDARLGGADHGYCKP